MSQPDCDNCLHEHTMDYQFCAKCSSIGGTAPSRWEAKKKPAASPWRPFSEAPRDGRWVLAMFDNGNEKWFRALMYGKKGWVDAHDYEVCEGFGNLTHYAEIYPPEKGEGE